MVTIKKYAKQFLALLLAFTFAFGEIPTSLLTVEAASYSKTGHELKSNTNMGDTAVPSLGHGSDTPFRKFVIDDKDDGARRVICGYSLGHAHPGDTYKKKVVEASAWDSEKINGEFVHNTKKIAKALRWFYEDIGPSNATTKQSYVIQVYIWAASMGRDITKALKELASSKNWDWSSVKKIKDKIEDGKAEGTVIIYENTKCNSGDSGHIHQPYFRWVKPEPKPGWVSASASSSVTKDVKVNVYKQDAQSKKPVKGAQIKVSTTGIAGSPWTLTTDANGKAEKTLKRSFSREKSAEENYIRNWDELTTKQKAYYKKQGYYQNKSLAQAAAKKEAEKQAKEEAEKVKASYSGKWTFEEVNVPGYIYKVNGKNKSITKTESGNSASVSVTFSNSPKYGEIEIKKEASGVYTAGYGLEGAVYSVRKDSANGTEVGQILIKKNGSTYSGSLGNLTIGDYYVKETKAPEGFDLDTTTYHFTLEDNGGDKLVAKSNGNTITSFTSKEVAKKGKIQLKKFLKETNGSVGIEPGVEFTLAGNGKLSDGTTYKKTAKTDANGVVTFDDVPYGIYTLTVTDSNLKGNISKVGPFTVTVEDDNASNKNNEYAGKNLQIGDGSGATNTIDEKLPCRVIIHKAYSKYDKNGIKDAALEQGAVFALYKSTGVQVGKNFTTDANGYAKSDEITETGTYTIKQVSGKEGYSLMDDITFNVKSSDLGADGSTPKLFEYTVDNPYAGMRIFLYKVSVPYNEDTGHYEESKKEPEAGAEFTVLDLAKLSSSEISELKKKGSSWSAADRKTYINAHKNAVAGTMTTDADGQASLDIDKPSKSGYVFIQTKGLSGYYLSKPIFTTDSGNSVVITNRGDAKQCNIMLENRQISRYAMAKFKKLKKVNGKDTAVESGVRFDVYRSDGTKLTDPDGNEVTSFTENGTVYIPWLSKGVYTLKQVGGSDVHESLDGDTNTEGVFAVTKEDLQFDEDTEEEVASNKSVSSLTEQEKSKIILINDGQIIDPEIPVGLKIRKTSTYTGVALGGTTFILYKKESDGSLKEIGKYTTSDGTDGGALGEVTINDLAYGTYVIKEIEATKGYLLSEYDTGIDSKSDNFVYQTREITIDEDHVVRDSDGNLYYAEKGNPFVHFKNSPIFGKIAIDKTGVLLNGYKDASNGFEYKEGGIPGAVYTLYAAEDIKDDTGKVIWKKDQAICDATTDAKGKATFKNNAVDYTDDFFMGEYYILEKSAPKGYALDTEKHTVTLTWQAGAEDIKIDGYQPSDDDFSEETSKGSYFLATGKKLNPYIRTAKKVVFTYETAPSNATVYDVSADRIGAVSSPTKADSNSTVVLWEDPSDKGVYYISTQKKDQEVKFNKDSSEMFYRCESVESIIFFHVDTSHMIYAERMFAFDTSLKELDLSNWETGNLNDTIEMFSNANALKTVYTGDEDQKPDTKEAQATGIYALPKYDGYLYADPSSDDAETLDARKLTVDSFNYGILYDDGSAENLELSASDIASISPEYPTFADASKKSGELEVTITLKSSCSQYKLADNGKLTVKINVIDPDTLDLTPKVNEHPSVTTKVTDNPLTISLSFLKVDANATGDLEQAGLGGSEFTVYAATDLKNADGKTIIKKGAVVTTVKSIAHTTDDGGRSGIEMLPASYFAVDASAPYLYKIVETKAPEGYGLYGSESQNTAYIPNVDYLNESSSSVLSKLDKVNPSTVKTSYSFVEHAYTFALTFKNTKAITIRKDWGSGATEVPESARPDSLTIRMYTDKEKKNLYKTITLKKSENWTYTFTGNIDLSKYTYEEVVPSGVKWYTDTSDFEGGYKASNNTVVFFNAYDNPKWVGVKVTKKWEDYENAAGIRPSEITVNLMRNGEAVSGYTGIKLNSSNNWTYQVQASSQKLPRYDENGEEYSYSWEEVTTNIPKDYEQTGAVVTTYTDGEYTGYATELTNTYTNYVESEINKNWNDESNLYGIRPSSITVHLYADGKLKTNFTIEYEEDGQTKTKEITDGNVTLNTKNGWRVKAIKLFKQQGGKEISYTWKEDAVTEYEEASNATSVSDEGSTTKITNKVTPTFGKVTVSKRIPLSSLNLKYGDIDFTFTLKGTTIHKTEYKAAKTVKFTADTAADKKNIVTVGGKEYLQLSVTFEDLDWGEYKITESGSESRYEFDKISGLTNATSGKESDGTPYVTFTVNHDKSEFTGTFENKPIPGKVKIVKYGNNKKKLSGVVFEIKKVTKGNNTEVVGTKTTDRNGEITFDDLDPGDYIITETKTVNGYSLLKDPIKFSIPLALTKTEANKRKADTTKAKYDEKNDLYFFYDLVYNVDNEATLHLPMTGGTINWLMYLPIAAAMVCFIGAGIYLFRRRRGLS